MIIRPYNEIMTNGWTIVSTRFFIADTPTIPQTSVASAAESHADAIHRVPTDHY